MNLSSPKKLGSAGVLSLGLVLASGQVTLGQGIVNLRGNPAGTTLTQPAGQVRPAPSMFPGGPNYIYNPMNQFNPFTGMTQSSAMYGGGMGGMDGGGSRDGGG